MLIISGKGLLLTCLELRLIRSYLSYVERISLVACTEVLLKNTKGYLQDDWKIPRSFFNQKL